MFFRMKKKYFPIIKEKEQEIWFAGFEKNRKTYRNFSRFSKNWLKVP